MDSETTSDTGPVSGNDCQVSKKGSEITTKETSLTPWEHELCKAVAARSVKTAVSILSKSDRTFSQKVLDDCLLDACGLYKKSNQHLVSELLGSGANIKAVSEDGWTPILIAVNNGDSGDLRFFLQRGADVNAVTAEGDSALTLSIRPNRSLDIIKLLLQETEIDKNYKKDQGYTALMKAVELRDLEVMKLLIDDHKCNNRETLAISEDSLDSDETIINCFGPEFFDVATRAGMVKVIKLLLHIEQGESLLMEAALRADVELVKIIIDCQFYNVQIEDSGDTTFLQNFFQAKKQRHLAIGDVDIPVVQILLENGAAVNRSENNQSSSEPPVITAVETGSLGLVQLMCKYGAKLDVTANSKTPLDVAAESGKADILQFLLKKHDMISGHAGEVTYKNSALHFCLVKGHTNCAEILMKHGYKMEVTCAAEYAFNNNKPAYLKFLLEQFPSSVNNFFFSTRRKWNTILTKAVTNDYVNIINTLAEAHVHLPDFLLSDAKSAAMVQLLVSNGASVNRRATTGNPVLLTLIRCGRDKTCVEEIVKILLEKGANVNDCNLKGVTPLIAAAQTWDSSELLNTLLLHGADVHKRDNQGMTAFLYALERNYTENIKLLIHFWGSQKLDIKLRNTSDTLLTLVAKYCDEDKLKKIMENGGEINHRNKAGYTALMLATCKNKTITELLLDRGADVNVEDPDGDTALTLVARYGEADTLKKIIERGADINHRNKAGYTALMLATRNNKTITELLLDRGADVNVEDPDGDTALTLVARHGDADTLKKIIERGADINHRNKAGYTALMLATRNNKTITELLLDRGADVNVEDPDGDTALTLVARYGEADTLKKIIERGADINHQNKSGYSALMYAAKNKYSDESNLEVLLLHGAKVNMKDDCGNTALLHAAAAKLERTEITKHLLDHEGNQKVNIDSQNTSGSSALMLAVGNYNEAISDLLLARGANVNIEDNNGDTALILTTKNKDEDTVMKILERGADINHQNKEGYSALMIAASKCHIQCMEVLLSAGADVNAVSHGQEKKTALSLLLETKSPYNWSEVYSPMTILLDKGARSTYLNPGVFFDAIQSKELWLISKLISSGFGPVELSSEKYLHNSEERMIFPVVSPFMFALLTSHPTLMACDFDDNWFLSTSDIQLQAKRDFAKEILKRRSNDERVDFLDEFCSEPMSLLKLSFVAVSSAIGCVPGREERVEKLSLPPRIKDKMLFIFFKFKEQEKQSDIIDSDTSGEEGQLPDCIRGSVREPELYN